MFILPWGRVQHGSDIVSGQTFESQNLEGIKQLYCQEGRGPEPEFK